MYRMDFRKCGFTATEIIDAVRCEPNDQDGADGRLMVPVEVNGTSRLFLLDTGASEAAILADAMARQLSLPVLGAAKQTAYNMISAPPARIVRIERFDSVMGGERDFAMSTSTLANIGMDLRTHRRAYTGLLGAARLGAGVLAIDPSGSRVAFTVRPIRAMLPAPDFCVRLCDAPNTYSPITEGRDWSVARGWNSWDLLDTGARWSHLSAETAARLGVDADGNRGQELAWRGQCIRTLFVGPPMAQFAAQSGVPRVDGILGMDMLAHWCTVFAIPDREVLFFPA